MHPTPDVSSEYYKTTESRDLWLQGHDGVETNDLEAKTQNWPNGGRISDKYFTFSDKLINIQTKFQSTGTVRFDELM